MKKMSFANAFSKKLKKYRLAVNLAAAALVFAFTVYTLLPKDEKFDEGEAQKIADAFVKKASEQELDEDTAEENVAE